MSEAISIVDFLVRMDTVMKDIIWSNGSKVKIKRDLDNLRNEIQRIIKQIEMLFKEEERKEIKEVNNENNKTRS